MKNILVALLFFTAVKVSAQTLPNPGFEDVITDSLVSYPYPSGWAFDGFGGSSSTTHVASGTYSASIWNWYYYGRAFMRNGINPSFSATTSYIEGGTPITGKPGRLSGFYVYDTSQTYSNNDSARVIVALKRWNVSLGRPDTVALSEARLPGTSTTSAMVPFDVDIIDLMPGVNPDSIVVTFLSSVSGFCDSTTTGECLFLYVDDLTLTITHTDGSVTRQPFVLYPNPTHESVFLQLQDQDADEYIISDYSGRTLLQGDISSSERSVPLAGLSAGTYLVTLKSRGIITGTQKLVVD